MLLIIRQKADEETLKKLTAQELTLNIAVNLGRLGRWASEGKANRLSQFLKETDGFVLAGDC